MSENELVEAIKAKAKEMQELISKANEFVSTPKNKLGCN